MLDHRLPELNELALARVDDRGIDPRASRVSHERSPFELVVHAAVRPKATELDNSFHPKATLEVHRGGVEPPTPCV